MQGSLVFLLFYLAIKLAAYSWYANLGLLAFGSIPDNLKQRSLVLALVRLGLGLAVGFVAMRALPEGHGREPFSIGHYVALFAALRWLEWSLISTLIARPKTIAAALLGGMREQVWRAGGVMVSFVTDILLLAGFVGVYGVPC